MSAAGFTASETAIPNTLSHRSVMTIFATLMGVMFLSALDQTIVSTALPTIVGDLGGLAYFSWVITAYTLAMTISMPIYGKLGDQFGRRITLLTAISLFVIGSVACALSTTMDQLIAFRALQGLGGGGLILGAQAVLADIMSPRDRAKYGGLMGAVFGIAAVVGPLLGGFLTEKLSWHWTFWINVPLGIVALVITYVTLRLPRVSHNHKVDYLGMALLSPAITGLILITTWGGTKYDWNSVVIMGLIVATTLFSIAFVYVEKRAAEPIIPMELFLNRTFSIGSAIGLLMGAAMFAASSYLPTYLQVVRNVSLTTSGLLMLPMVAGIFVASTLAGRIVSKTGHYYSFPILGMGVSAVGVVLLSTLDEYTSSFVSSLYMIVLGIGLGLVIQTVVLAVQNSVDANHIGVATATNNFFREIGICVGVSVFGSIFSHRLTERLGEAAGSAGFGAHGAGSVSADQKAHLVHEYVQALTPAFIFLVPLLIIGFVIAFFMPRVKMGSTSGMQRRAQEIVH